MRIAFLSKFGDGADIAFRMAALEGHDVRLYIDDQKYKGNFDGMIAKSATWQAAVRNSDLAVFDDNRLTEIWNQVHRSLPCFGGSAFGARLENDRAYARGLAARLKLKQPEHLVFKKAPEVIDHLRAHPVAHVIKPQGDKAESHHTIIGEDPDGVDAILLAERLPTLGVPFTSFEVEERKFGLEVAIGRFFDGAEWVGPPDVNFEHKRSIDGNQGPLCGERGTLMRYVESEGYKFFDQTLGRWQAILAAAHFQGQLDLNFIANEEGWFFLEPTPRLGKPAVFIEDELHVTPWADLFHHVATGDGPGLEVHPDWGVGTVRFGCGFPFEKEHARLSQGLPVLGLHPGSAKGFEHVHPMQLRLAPDKEHLVTGYGEGYLLVGTGRGRSPWEAKDAALKAVDSARVNSSWRSQDIGDRIDLGQAMELGVLPREGAGHAVAAPR